MQRPKSEEYMMRGRSTSHTIETEPKADDHRHSIWAHWLYKHVDSLIFKLAWEFPIHVACIHQTSGISTTCFFLFFFLRLQTLKDK
jgi:hypothetical protein